MEGREIQHLGHKTKVNADSIPLDHSRGGSTSTEDTHTIVQSLSRVQLFVTPWTVAR